MKLADGTVLPRMPYAMPDVISLITWIPVLMIPLVLFLGRKHLPHSPIAWWHTLGKAAPSFGVIGITIIAAFSASNVLAELGLAKQLRVSWKLSTPRPGSWPSSSGSSSS